MARRAAIHTFTIVSHAYIRKQAKKKRSEIGSRPNWHVPRAECAATGRKTAITLLYRLKIRRNLSVQSVECERFLQFLLLQCRSVYVCVCVLRREIQVQRMTLCVKLLKLIENSCRFDFAPKISDGIIGQVNILSKLSSSVVVNRKSCESHRKPYRQSRIKYSKRCRDYRADVKIEIDC